MSATDECIGLVLLEKWLSHSYDCLSNSSLLRAPIICKRPQHLARHGISPCNRMMTPCSRNHSRPTLTSNTLTRSCTRMSSLLLPCHHSSHSVAHKSRIAPSTDMDLTPQASHEIIARRFISITDGTSDWMLVVGTHTLPDVVFAIACLLRSS